MLSLSVFIDIGISKFLYWIWKCPAFGDLSIWLLLSTISTLTLGLPATGFGMEQPIEDFLNSRDFSTLYSMMAILCPSYTIHSGDFELAFEFNEFVPISLHVRHMGGIKCHWHLWQQPLDAQIHRVSIYPAMTKETINKFELKLWGKGTETIIWFCVFWCVLTSNVCSGF